MDPNNSGQGQQQYGGGAPAGMGRGGGYVPPPHPQHQHQQQQQQYPPQMMEGGRGRGGYYPPAQPAGYGGGAPDGYGGGGGGYNPNMGGEQSGSYNLPMQQQQHYQQQQMQQQQQQHAYMSGGGGYSGGGGGYGGGANYLPQQQQGYGYNNAPHQNPYYQGGGGGYPQQHMPHNQYQQQYQQHCYQQQQQPGGYYGGGGRGFGGPRGGGGGRGGGRGGRGGFGRDGRNQVTSFILHVDSFARLDELGRHGVLDGIVPQQVVFNMTQQARGQPIRVLVIVDKKYLGARMSFPKMTDDIILSEKTVTEFLDIHRVTADDGACFLDTDNGSMIPRRLYFQLGNFLEAVLPFDKQQPVGESAAAVDVAATAAGDLLRDMTTHRAVFDVMLARIDEDTAASTEFFTAIVTDAFAEVLGNKDDEESNAGDDENNEQQQQQPQARQPSRRILLLTSPQGVKLLVHALRSDKKRKAFYDLMKPASTAAAAAAEAPLSPEEVPPTTLSEALFKAVFTGSLTAGFIFESFGLSAGPAATAAADGKLKLRTSEVDILCECFAKYGLSVISSNGGCGTAVALLKRLRPNYATNEAYYQQQRGGNRGRNRNTADQGAQDGARGVKRGRDEADAGQQQQAARTEGGAASGTTRSAEEAGSSVPTAPASLDKYQPPAAPSDWRFFHAFAAAVTSGDTARVKSMGRRPSNCNPHYQQGQEQQPVEPEPTPEPNEDPVSARIRLVTERTVSCRGLQTLIPHLADTLLESEKKVPTAAKQKAFVTDAERILTAIAKYCDKLMSHHFGNYVAQTFIIELAPRSIAGSKVEAIAHLVLDIIAANILEMSVQKFASNCCDRAIVASEGVHDGCKFVTRIAKVLIDSGHDRVLGVARNPFGNYVVRHICERLSAYGTGADSSAPADVQAAAKDMERQFFTLLLSRRMELQQTPYGQGIVGWIYQSGGRILQG